MGGRPGRVFTGSGAGFEYLHDMWVLHRDVKPENFLLSARGVLKVADFGLAKLFGDASAGAMTTQVVTQWYKAPELLFGAQFYGGGVDMWAMGCIHVELELRHPFLVAPSESDISQLETIFKTLGTTDEADWPGVSKLSGYMEFKCAGGPPPPPPPRGPPPPPPSAPPPLIVMEGGVTI